MIGKTELELNTQTMVEAVQQYLEKKITPGDTRVLKVLSVSEQGRAGYHGTSYKVAIEVTEKDAATVAP
jgi:hypothetical protein